MRPRTLYVWAIIALAFTLLPVRAVWAQPCGVLHPIEQNGFLDGTLAIGDLLSWEYTDVDTEAVLHDVYTIDLRTLTGVAGDQRVLTGTSVTVRPVVLAENDVLTWLPVSRTAWNPADSAGTVTNVRVCSLSVALDNAPPAIAAGCILGSTVINGNYIDNASLAGRNDTLRIFWRTVGACDGGASVGGHRLNDDAARLAVWFDDFLDSLLYTGAQRRYPVNAAAMGLQTAGNDTLAHLWVGRAFSAVTNDTLYVDIPFNATAWPDSVQLCIAEALAAADTIYAWGLDDAGNRSNRGIVPGGVCLDNVPPPTELGSDIYYETCGARFSPGHSYFTNLSPDSTFWFKDKVDTAYNASVPRHVFDKVYLIGFGVRTAPDEDPDGTTGAVVALPDYIHPRAPLGTVHAVPWEFYGGVDDTTSSVRFIWYGKQRAASGDPDLSVDPAFWNCDYGLLLGVSLERWMDAAGNNRIIRADHDLSTDIDENYTTLNQLQTVADLCPPRASSPGDTLHFVTPLPAGPAFGSLSTYEWAGPNGVAADPRLRFRTQRNFTQGLADECLKESTLEYRVRVDSLLIPGGADAWTPGADSVFFFSSAHAAIGIPTGGWTPIAFNANDINSPQITFNFGHRFAAGYLPDGLYRLTLEVKDPAGNVYREPGINLWLSGAGPDVTVAQFVDAGGICRADFSIGQDLCVRVVTDATATSVLVDWSCVHGITAASDSALLTTFENIGELRVWTACLPVTADIIDGDPAFNTWELDSAQSSCVSGDGHVAIRVTAFDAANYPTRYDAPPSNPCRLATVGGTGCAAFLRAPEFSFYDPDSLELNDGDFRGRVAPYDVFAPAPRWNAISPGSLGGSSGPGEYDARLNPARDGQQDSVWVRLLLHLTAISADTTDTLVLRFTNDMGTVSTADDRVRQVRKGLFHPTAADMIPDPLVGNTWYDGFQELWNLDLSVLEFRYLWNGTWFTAGGTDSLMLVPLGTKGTVHVSATLIEGADGSECSAITGLLRVDNTTPDFVAVFPIDTLTGTTATVENLRPRPVCGICYGDGDRFRVRVRLNEEVHYDAADYPNEAGSHSALSGDWPLTRGWQISPIDLRTGKVVGFGPDSVVVQLDSVLVDKRSDSEVYYTLAGTIHIPAAATLPYDSVALVIRAAWDQGGNPGRYNNPVFDDAWRWDSAEDTTFRIILHPHSLAGTATAAPSVPITGPCGDRCRLDNATGSVTAVFESDGIDVTRAWLTVVRNDGLFAANLGDLSVDALDTNRFHYTFGGNLCGFWQAHALDMGCYHFTVHFTDNTAAEDSLTVTMDCGGTATDLICIDCEPALPAAVTLDSLRLTRWDCIANARITVTEAIPNSTTEIAGRSQGIGVIGHLPGPQQYVHSLYLWAESADAPFAAAIVDSLRFDTTFTSAGRSFAFSWNTTALTGGGAFVYPTGQYRLWLEVRDAVCQSQITDSFTVNLDQAIPTAAIVLINGHAPNALAPDTLDTGLGGDSTVLHIDWTDGLVPDDSTQPHNRVRMWAKRQSDPNLAVSWFEGGLVTFPAACDPHTAVLHSRFACDVTYDLVAVATDEWGADAELNASAAVAAFTAGRTLDVRVIDTTPPVTQLWGLTLPDGRLVAFDQQNYVAAIGGGAGTVVTLNAFTANGDVTVDHVRFQYSLDALAWTDIATDGTPELPMNCASLTPPLPWWCGLPDSIMWQATWPLGDLRGDVYLRAVATDRCGNTEADAAVYVLSIDVDAAVARAFVWPSDLHVDTLSCTNWSEPQIGATIQPQTILTLGACPDTAMHDAYGAIWYIKRADDQPLAPSSWCALGDDSTAPFSLRDVNLWSGPCAVPQAGVTYDIAALTTDRLGNHLTFSQLLNYGQGATWQDKWQWLIDHFYVKRFRVLDTTAPVAFDLMAGPDHTPDSSAIFLTGNVTLTARVNAPDAVAVTFAVRVQGASGPWTQIERVEGDSGTFQPVEGHWNTELLNGIYILGAFAEDANGNIDGDVSGVGAGPTYTLTVHVDNERPAADIVSVTAGGLPVTTLERGRAYRWALSATDNFAVRYITLLYRHAGGNPAAWVPVDTAHTQPYTIEWTIPPQLVVGWTYEFAAVATDLVHLTDLTDAQQQYLVDTTFTISDDEAGIALFTIGGQDAASLPHINGTNVPLVAHSDGNLNNARFVWVQDSDTTVIGTVEGAFGQTEWMLNGWDVSLLPEDTIQIGVVGLSDIGGTQIARGEDFRVAIIDHRLTYTVDATSPASHALLGGVCALDATSQTDALTIDLAAGITDIDTVAFEWKRTADPDVAGYWHLAGFGRLDELTNSWTLDWNAGALECGLIDLRARLGDNAVPQSNEDTLQFADSVRVDNCAPVVVISNVNGDLTPEHTEIARGQVATIIATVTEPLANGGNGSIDSVCFYVGRIAAGDSAEDWTLIGCDTDGAPWQALWNTGGATFAAYELRAMAWDAAGNCGLDLNRVTITDQLYQRAWIVGFDTDNGFGCLDRLWAVTDDCEPNFTSDVRFQYSTNGGAAWVSLGSDASGELFCEAGLDYHVWMLTFEADSVPAGAVYRAVASDESHNDDPNPPRFLFNDVTNSNAPAIFNEDLVRVPVTAGQVPWVFSVLETGASAQNCFTAGALVCVNPAAGNPALYEGVLDATTKPCVLNGTDGRETVFSSVPVNRGGTTFMVLTRYQMAIHAVSAAAGSNGWLVSEDNQAQVFVPTDGVTGIGTLWFEPQADSGAVNWIPPAQSWYSLLSPVEYVMTKDLGTGLHAPQYRLRFNPVLLPVNPQSWQVVAAFFDAATGLWNDRGVVYASRDLTGGSIEFSFPPQTSWSASDLNTACPGKLVVAVLLTAVQPLEAWVRIGDNACPTAPDSTYYSVGRGPATDCTPTFFATLRQGEFVPAQSSIDVLLDSLRIIHDGVTAAGFDATYNLETGILTFALDPEASNLPPFFGCLSAGAHTVQIFVDERQTNPTPFFVDATPPVVSSAPGWVQTQITLGADIVDAESGLDTTSIAVVLRNCAMANGGIVRLGADRLTLTAIANGYHAAVTLPWEQVQHLFASQQPGLVDQLCVDWEAANRVCLHSTANESLTYLLDMLPPQVTALSPVGAALDDDNDGAANEDPIDCIDNDTDGRIDEDPVNFLSDTLAFGQRPLIEFRVSDPVACGSGATGLNLASLMLEIDGHAYAPADTGNAALAFHLQVLNGRELLVRFGGSVSGASADTHYTAGGHRVVVSIADSLGNLPPVGYSWDYFLRAAGPAIVFADSARPCGLWFDPETVSHFAFCVDATAEAPLRPDGIRYSVYTVPGGARLLGPVPVHPVNPLHECVTVSLQPSLPDGETGVELVVDAFNMQSTPEDSATGASQARFTYWADRIAPRITDHQPVDNAVFTRNDVIVVDILFNDDAPAMVAGKAASLDRKPSGTPASPVKRAAIIAKTDNGIGSLDGSGVDTASVQLSLLTPDGETVPLTQFAELDISHARVILPAGQAAGRNTLSARVQDCVGNSAIVSWTFTVTGTAPEIGFLPVPADTVCGREGFWSPGHALRLLATVRETDSVNIAREGLRVDILRFTSCQSGLCVDTLVPNAPFNLGAVQPNPNDAGQLFELSGYYPLTDAVNALELRVAVTATNILGITARAAQSWAVDAVAPWIQPVSPVEQAVLPADQPVTISANFGDGELMAAIASGHSASASLPGSGPVRNGKATITKATSDAQSRLGKWSGAIASSLDETESDSGIDTACVDLRLAVAGGETRNLTSAALTMASGIRWTGDLEEGQYTVLLSVCDRLCNSRSVQWSFEVSRHAPGADTQPPIIVSVEPDPADTLRRNSTPVFVVGFAEQGRGELDSASISLRLETANGDTIGGELTIDLATNRLTASASLRVTALRSGRYRLYAVASDLSGNRVDSIFTYLVGTDDDPENPAALLNQIPYNYPNPFDAGGTTRFWLPLSDGGGAQVQIRIFDFAGQLVKDLYNGTVTTATVIEWNGTNNAGARVANGVYLAHVRLGAGGAVKEDIVKVAFRSKQ